jgi:hypothetical protein
MTEREDRAINPEKRKAYDAFAAAYADPRSPTHLKAEASYLAVVPEAKKGAGSRKAAERWLKKPYVMQRLDAIQSDLRVKTGISASEYVERLLKREEMLAMRGLPGDAGAAARYANLIGTALGHLVHRSEDMTPKERKVTGDELAAQLIEQFGRLQRLREPNPATPLLARPAQPVEEADFTIEDVRERAPEVAHDDA